MAEEFDSSSPRPTLRIIAEAAGVSATVVSRALRNHPKVALATRERVQRVADQLGYRPDTEVSKLMYHLRTRQKPRFQSLLCALTTVPKDAETPYMVELIESARSRAEALGHRLDVMRISSGTKRNSFTRILRSRGVEGILLLPLPTPCNITELVDWTQFSVLAATHAVLEPEFNCVTPDQFGNTMLLCRELTALGYRRIGLVVKASHDVRVRHGFSAAAAWQSLMGGTELVVPLLQDSLAEAELHQWFDRERPDVVIGAGADDCLYIARRLALDIPGPLGFAATNCNGSSNIAGIDERPSSIGVTAIDRLHAQIIRGEKGIPTLPVHTTIPGRWVSTPSCGARHAPSGPFAVGGKKEKA